MSKAICFLFLLSICSFGVIGCGEGSTAPKATGNSELEQYMADHPELANEEMAELNE